MNAHTKKAGEIDAAFATPKANALSVPRPHCPHHAHPRPDFNLKL
jgi:hypothetical protein